MQFTRRIFILLAAVAALLSGPAMATDETDGIHKLAIQVSDNDPATFNKALNVATNFARGMSEKGEFFEIEIVTFNAGLHMIREDTSPVMERIMSISDSIPEIGFSACGNTMAGMARNEGAEPPITSVANVVPAGVVRLMELEHDGWYVIRP